MPTTDKAEQKRQLDDFQGLIIIEKSPRGRKLKQPITVQIPKNLSLGEKAVRRYVIDAFCWKMAELIHFTFRNDSVLKLATRLYNSSTGSEGTLYQYTQGAHTFFKWLEKEPDLIVKECLRKGSTEEMTKAIDKFIGELKAKQKAPGTIANYVKSVKQLFRANGLEIILPYRLNRRVKYRDRSPTSKELEKIIDLADIREKVIVSTLALSGVRIGTLVKLEYRHVKKDLEAGVIPVHIHVEADITKGKYCDYDTFITAEAVKYLKAYLEVRRNGTWYMPREEIADNSPLIRNQHSRNVRSVTQSCIYRLIHRLYVKAGLLDKTKGKVRYRLRPHSIRKYFNTQLKLLGVYPELVEYMSGHVVSTYNDLQSMDVNTLREKYAVAGLCIRQKEKADIYDFVEEILRNKGYSIDRTLLKRAIAKPHRTICSPRDYEEERRTAIRNGFMEMLRKELLDPSLEQDVREQSVSGY